MKKNLAILSVIILLGVQSLIVTASVEFDNDNKSITSISNNYNMVIITPNQFSSSLNQFIDHKNSIGINTFLKTTEEIYEEYQGRDQAEQIKYYIKESIEQNNISYVLLIGDITKLPIRTSMVEWNYLGLILTQYIKTDLYYSDVFDANGTFCSWDSNNNNLFGEYKWIFETEEDFTYELIDSVDLYPDVGIGRIPCKTNNELDIVINKIIAYEENKASDDWFKKIILMGGDTFPNEGVSEGEFITEYIYNYMAEFDFEPIKLFTSNNKFTMSNINKEWTNGAGFISFSGHGGKYQIATHPYNQNKMNRYYMFYLFGIQNNEKLPVVFLDACETAIQESSFLGLPCFSWLTLKYRNGGSIAVIGNTGYGYSTIISEEIIIGASLLNILFFESYEEEITLSDMFTAAQSKYLDVLPWKDCLTIQEYNLFGDPSLKIGGYT